MNKVNPRTICRYALRACLAVTMGFVSPLAVLAQPELVSSTEVTAHYDIFAWFKSSGKPAQTAMSDAQLNSIEPASGGGEAEGAAPAEDSSHAGLEGDKEGPHATGKTEGQKSFSGKVIGKIPDLPKVTIGGQTIITSAAAMAAELKETTPEKLRDPNILERLARRSQITPYAHSPQEILHPSEVKPNQAPDGVFHPTMAATAPIKVIEFVDFSCNQCMAEVAKIDAALQDLSTTILVNHIHAPTGQFQDTNMQAFYGKVAARAGVFWQYRAAIVRDKPADAAAMFDVLVKAGVDIPTTRSLMMNEARRFYRELDADALLARSFGISHPPVVFVNGIRVGENGLPLEAFPDVLKYVDARIRHNLPEPPK
jgi:protein-disulfide isomerase